MGIRRHLGLRSFGISANHQNMNTLIESRLSIPQDVLINEVGGEAVLLNLKTERYYGLDEVGTRMWQVMTTADSLDSAHETLLAEYDVEPGKLREDMDKLVDKLLSEGLLERSDA